MSVFKKNIQAYEYVLKLEIGLREFLIKKFDKILGKDWDLDKSGQGVFSNTLIKDIEEKEKWSKKNDWETAKKINLIYMLSFGELKNLIKDCCPGGRIYKINENCLGINLREIKNLISLIENITPIRNNMAHSRIISDKELKILKRDFNTINNDIINLESYLNRQIEIEHAELRIIKTVIDNIRLSKNISVFINLINNEESILRKTIGDKANKFLKLIKDYNNITFTGNQLDINLWKQDNNQFLNEIKEKIK